MTSKANVDTNTINNIIQAVPVGIVAIRSTGQVAVWNSAAEAILGWRYEEVAGDSSPVELPLTPGEEMEIRRRRKDTSLVDLHVRTIGWQDSGGTAVGALVFLTDVTARRAVEHTVRELTAEGQEARSRARESMRFRELLEAAPDAIIEIEREGQIVLLNKAAEQLFGYTREELLGKPLETLIPSDAQAAHRAHRNKYWASPTTRPMGTGLKLEGQRKDGSRVPVEISLSPVQFEEGFRVSAIIRDVSERRLAEEQLRSVQAAYTEELAAKNRELEVRNEEVERANRLKSEFLSGMSHELRTPLHTIIGFTELLEEELEGPLNEKQQRFMRHIHKDSQHLLALINDVLDLSKIESGRLELQPELFSLIGALDETVSSIRPRGQAKSIHIETLVSHALDIYADRLRFKQILYNLLSNAVKFTPEGGRVWIEVTASEAFIEVSVSDTGIGIPLSEQESVFDRFYQVGQRQAGGHEGTGLGLAITRHLVDHHGGSIRLQSELGKGSRFTFSIPLVKTVEPAI
jgi:PAS domain S-box-containing protein